MLRWREEELRHQRRDGWVVWLLACMVVVNAIRKKATVIFVKKISPTKLVVLYAIDGAMQEEMTPPAKLGNALVAQMMTLGGPLDVMPGARAQFEVVRNDGVVLTGHLNVGENEFGLTGSLRFTTPPRVLN